MDEHTLTLIAQYPEHCTACYRLIHPGETYHQTAEYTVLCQGCADFEALDTIQATGDLAVEMGEDMLRVRRGGAWTRLAFVAANQDRPAK